MNISRIINCLCEHGHHAYVVGGVVRDILAGLPSKDTDVVTSATPEQIQEIFKTHDVKTVGKSFGVVLVDGIEVATFRHDRYGGLNSRQCLVSFVSSIEEDLARRDFTINSMAFCEFTGDLIDLFGGKGDLENKIIRFVGNPKDRIYEDPNRIVRACRFLAKIDGQFDCETYEALCAHAHYVKDHVAGERIRLEILKALELPRPSLFFRALFEIGVLDYIFPSMIPCVGHHHGKHHREEIFTHLMIVGDHISPKFPLLRLAGYLHDVGKPISYTEDGKFLGHEIAGAEIITRELQVLRFSNEEIAKISNLVKVHMNSYLGCSQKALRRLLRRFFEENVTFHEFLRLRITDCIGNLYKPNLEIGEIKTILYKYKEAIKEKSPTGIQMLAINGHEIMGVLGIPPGPKVGKILNSLLEYVIEHGPEYNTKENLIKELAKIGKEQAVETKPCTKCSGTGKGSVLYPKCPFCRGKGSFEKPDYVAICQAIKGRKGLRAVRPQDNRAYFVWRLARFHGGADITMPMVAMSMMDGDPYEEELNLLAEIVARKIFGTDIAGVHRWGRALGYLDQDIGGLPPSAYSAGPVADEHKPLEEAAELL